MSELLEQTKRSSYSVKHGGTRRTITFLSVSLGGVEEKIAATMYTFGVTAREQSVAKAVLLQLTVERTCRSLSRDVKFTIS